MESKTQKSFIWTNQKATTCSYGYKLVCLDDKFSKPFKTYLGKDVVYNFINSVTEESKCCSEVIKKKFNKELVMTKESNENLRTLLNFGSVTMIMLIMMLK